VSVVESSDSGESAFGVTLRSGESVVLIALDGRLLIGIEAETEGGTTRTLFPTLEDPLETLHSLSQWAEGAAAAERVRRIAKPPVAD
jgi:hypothetical protein